MCALLKRDIIYYVLIIIFFLPGCNNGASSIKLDGEWGYRPGFDQSWLLEKGPSGWNSVTIPSLILYPGCRSYREGIPPPRAFTLRKEIPPEAVQILKQKKDPVFYISHMTGHKIEFYLNNRLFGTLGSFDPDRPAMSREFIQFLPHNAVSNIHKNFVFIVFHIRGYDRVSHGIYEVPEIDDPLPLFSRYNVSQITDFVLLTIYLCIGIIFLLLGLRLPNNLYSLYFGFFSICFTFFEMANLDCRELIFGDNILLRMKVDKISLKLMIAAFALFITLLFVKKHTKIVMGLTMYCVILAAFDVFRGLEQSFDDVVNFWHLAVIIGFPYVLYILFKESLKKNIDALILIAGVVIFAVSSVQNILVAVHVINQKGIPLHYTTLGIFISVVIMLINRYVIIHKELSELNDDLEKKVDQRTRELQRAGEKIILLKRKEKFIDSFDLTSREKEILELIMEGHSVNDIQPKLGISFRTVNNHIYNLYQKMGVHSRMDIIAALDKMTV